MDIFECFAKRRSIRAYTDRPVSDEQLRKIAEAVSLAPSACNRQPWKLLAIRDAKIRAAVADAGHWPMLHQAPVILAAIGNDSAAWQRVSDDHSIIEVDVGIMFQQALLAATAQGLSSCWVCAYNGPEMDAAIGVKPPFRTIALSPLGYAAEGPRDIVRKSTDEIFEII